MTEDEREAIWQQAYENIAKRDAEAAELAERRERNLAYVAPPPEQYRRVSHARREAKLDTDFGSIVDAKIAAAHEYWRSVLPELIAAERADADAKIAKLGARIKELEVRAIGPEVAEALGNDARALKAEIATLQRCIKELRGTVAHVGDNERPTQRRYPFDLN